MIIRVYRVLTVFAVVSLAMGGGVASAIGAGAGYRVIR
jgi:hypothetical protein